MKELMATGHGAKEFHKAYVDPKTDTDWDACYEGFDAAVDWYVSRLPLIVRID